MRYIVEIIEEGTWNTLLAMQQQGKILIVEKSDPLEEMKERLRKIARAIEILEKVGIDRELIEAYIKRKCSGVPISHIKAVLTEEYAFFEKLGVKLK